MENFWPLTGEERGFIVGLGVGFFLYVILLLFKSIADDIWNSHKLSTETLPWRLENHGEPRLWHYYQDGPCKPALCGKGLITGSPLATKEFNALTIVCIECKQKLTIENS